VQKPGNKVAFLSPRGKYLTAYPDGGSARADVEICQGWEHFELRRVDSGLYGILSAHGYLSVEGGSAGNCGLGDKVVCNRSKCLEWEQFTFEAFGEIDAPPPYSPTASSSVERSQHLNQMGVGATIVGGVMGGMGAVGAVPAAAGVIGFTSAGIASGSTAAGMMSAAAVANGYTHARDEYLSCSILRTLNHKRIQEINFALCIQGRCCCWKSRGLSSICRCNGLRPSPRWRTHFRHPTRWCCPWGRCWVHHGCYDAPLPQPFPQWT
jgi:hypothetical protein